MKKTEKTPVDGSGPRKSGSPSIAEVEAKIAVHVRGMEIARKAFRDYSETFRALARR